MLTSMIILFNVLFVSCASNEPIDISSIEKEVAEELAEDPFKEAESQMKVLGSLGHGLNDKLDKNEFIEYSGTDVEIDYYVELEGNVNNIGFLLFLKGEPQPYKIKGAETEYEYMHPLTVDEERKQFTFQFTPIVGKKGEVLELQVISIYNPVFIPDMTTTSAYGNYHHALPTIIDRVKMVENAPDQGVSLEEYNGDIVISPSQQAVNITEEFLDVKFHKIEMEELNTYVFSRIHYNGETTYSNINLSQLDKFEVSYCLFGVPNAEFVTTFYINHKPIYSTEVTLQKGKYEQIDLELDTTQLDGLNSFYVMSVPKTERKYDEEIVIMDKTDTILLYKDANATSDDSERTLITESPISLEPKNIYYGSENKLLLLDDALTLAEYPKKRSEATYTLNEENIRSEDYISIDSGYVAMLCTREQAGFLYRYIYLNHQLEYEKEIVLNDIVEGEMILGPAKIAISQSGEKILISTMEHLYVYDVSTQEKNIVLDYSEENNGIQSISEMAFVDNDTKIAFTAETFDLPMQDGDGSFETYGFMSLDGTIITNKKPSYGNDTNLRITAYKDYVLFEDAGRNPSGKVLVIDVKTHEEKIYDVAKRGELMSLFGSNQGKYFAVGIENKDELFIEVYETGSGERIHQMSVDYKDQLHYKVLLLDESQQGMVLLRKGSSDNLVINTVEFTF